MSLDDIYNNFNIVEQEVKRTTNSSSSSQNIAFMSSPSSTNDVNNSYGVSTANTQASPVSTQVSTASTQVSTANLSDVTIYAFLASQPNGTVNVEETTSNAMVAIDGANFDWSYMADDEVPTNMALMDFSDSKSLDKLIVSQIPDNSKKGVGFVSYNAIPPPPTGLFSPPKLDLSNSSLEEFQQPEFEDYGPKTSKSVREDIPNEVKESLDALLVKELVLYDKLEKKNANCNYHQRERVVSRNNYTRVNYNNSTRKTHSNSHRNMAPRAVLMTTGLRPLNTAMPVNTAHPKTTVYSARPMLRFSKSAQSTVKRPYQQRTTLTNKSFSQKVNTAKRKFYTARPRAVNTVRPNSTMVNDVRGHPQKEDQDYVDSGCLRHMTGNMSYLSDFKEFDRGYVTFGGGAKGGKITGKGTLKTVDESQVLLKVPRKNNMYSVDMKNIVPKESLTCLVAKATLDESMLWHRRICHVNFKTINKLVKENLVRGLPIKCFENDQTCVACLKGKQHKASCKSKIQNSITQPLFMLHMDLFGPSSNRVLVVKPHNKTPYELFRGRTPALSFMRLFGCHVTILNTLDHLRKFDGKSDDGLFVGYSLNSKAFRVYNVRTRKVEENMHIRFLEDKPIIAGDGPKWLFDIDALTKSMNYVPLVAGTNSNDFVATEESIGASHASKNANNDEPQPFSDAEKKDDDGGYTQEEGIDYDEVVALVARIEAIMLFLAYASFKDFVVYQIDVKSVFLYGKIKEEVYVCQPLGFEDPEFLDRVYKKDDGIFISQDTYVDEILKKFGFLTVKAASTPMETSKPLLKDENAKDVDVHLYRLMIGSLMYLTSSRLDIMFAVYACARF
nr:hypothetical protein [Tanacetum cinerariifolium]